MIKNAEDACRKKNLQLIDEPFKNAFQFLRLLHLINIIFKLEIYEKKLDIEQNLIYLDDFAVPYSIIFKIIIYFNFCQYF